MTTASTSVHANLYLGNPETDPSPVFRDLSPEGVHLPDGTLVAWPEGAVFAVYFDGEKWSAARLLRPGDVDTWNFYGADGWPLLFPTECKVASVSFRAEFQTFPYGWSDWPLVTLHKAAKRERENVGELAMLRAQSPASRQLLRRVPVPRFR